MKITQIAFLTSTALVGDAKAMNLRSLFLHTDTAAVENEAATLPHMDDIKYNKINDYVADLISEEGDRALANLWYPNRTAGWGGGYCQQLATGNEPGFSTQLACCKKAYAGQTSAHCVKQLPTPPTTSPTKTGGLQDFWYPQYEKSWAAATCSNKGPLPYKNRGDRNEYSTQLACCKKEYAGQLSGACLAGLPSPPTVSPTGTGGWGKWIPNRTLDYSVGVCTNIKPNPYIPGAYSEFDTQLECCKKSYGSQTSGKCLGNLPSPPTVSPTGTGGWGKWIPDRSLDYSVGVCTNIKPKPYIPGSYTEFDTQLACCKRSYGSQTSGKCLGNLVSPPTVSPTTTGGWGKWISDRNPIYGEGLCTSTKPNPYILGAYAEFDTQLACCKKMYGSQTSGKCLASLPSAPSPTSTVNAPTTKPTHDPNKWYPDRTSKTCANDGTGSVYESPSTTEAMCCTGHFGSNMDRGRSCHCPSNPCFSCDCPNAAACKTVTCTVTTVAPGP